VSTAVAVIGNECKGEVRIVWNENRPDCLTGSGKASVTILATQSYLISFFQFKATDKDPATVSRVNHFYSKV
jgi:hypothetical protein